MPYHAPNTPPARPVTLEALLDDLAKQAQEAADAYSEIVKLIRSGQLAGVGRGVAGFWLLAMRGERRAAVLAYRLISSTTARDAGAGSDGFLKAILAGLESAYQPTPPAPAAVEAEPPAGVDNGTAAAVPCRSTGDAPGGATPPADVAQALKVAAQDARDVAWMMERLAEHTEAADVAAVGVSGHLLQQQFAAIRTQVEVTVKLAVAVLSARRADDPTNGADLPGACSFSLGSKTKKSEIH